MSAIVGLSRLIRIEYEKPQTDSEQLIFKLIAKTGETYNREPSERATWTKSEILQRQLAISSHRILSNRRERTFPLTHTNRILSLFFLFL
jgi:hypothetical protein